MTSYLPCFISHELKTQNFNYTENKQICTNSFKREIEEILLEMFFPVIILVRLCSPRPKISPNEFSKLLLLNVSLVADILEMTNALHMINKDCSNLFHPTLVFISLANITLAFGFTSKSRPHKINVNQFTIVRILKKFYENEIWTILFLLFLRDM